MVILTITIIMIQIIMIIMIFSMNKKMNQIKDVLTLNKKQLFQQITILSYVKRNQINCWRIKLKQKKIQIVRKSKNFIREDNIAQLLIKKVKIMMNQKNVINYYIIVKNSFAKEIKQYYNKINLMHNIGIVIKQLQEFRN